MSQMGCPSQLIIVAATLASTLFKTGSVAVTVAVPCLFPTGTEGVEYYSCRGPLALGGKSCVSTKCMAFRDYMLARSLRTLIFSSLEGCVPSVMGGRLIGRRPFVLMMYTENFELGGTQSGGGVINTLNLFIF
jgi:hypothetical protein